MFTVILPPSLTQLYLNNQSGSKRRPRQPVSYSCVFDDRAEIIESIAPDLLIKIGPLGAVNSSRQEQLKMKRAIVASPKLIEHQRPRTPAELELLRYASLSREDPKYFFINQPELETVVIEPKLSFGSNSISAAHEGALQGIAFAVLPTWLVSHDIEEGRLISLLPKWHPEEWEFQLILSQSHQHCEAAQQLLEHFQDELLTLL